MNTSVDTTPSVDPKGVHFDEERFWVEMTDSRTLGVPLAWYPRLLHATPAQREKFWLSPCGLHWDEIDEDISLEGLIAGRRDQTKKRTVAA